MGSYLNACFPSVPVFSRRRITHFFSAGACASLLVYFVYLCLLFLLVGFSFLFFLHHCALLLGAVMDPPVALQIFYTS